VLTKVDHGVRWNEQWKTPREVIARTAIERYPFAVFAGDDAEAGPAACGFTKSSTTLSALVGRHGAMNPAGRVRTCNIMPIAKH
jgi:hypothetical protein